MSAKDLHVSRWEMKRLQWFVFRAHQDGIGDLLDNDKSIYCFIPIAVNKDNIGLVSIWRRGHPHEGRAYFINGQKFITPLRLGVPVSPVRFDPPEPSVEEKAQMNRQLEKAIARHADELDDSLKHRIRQAFKFSRK
jgi:hypothetical protein